MITTKLNGKMTPWEQWGMTETEYREYQDEYADWLDNQKAPA